MLEEVFVLESSLGSRITKLFNNPNSYFRYDAFMYIGAINFRFFEDGFLPKANRFY